MKDKNKIDSYHSAHLENARQTDVLSTGLQRLFQRLTMTAGRLTKYPESRHSGAREAIHTLGRRHCERSAAIQSHERTRQRSHLPSPAFTIVELLVVIVVIAILAAITIVGYRNVSSNARKSAMVSDLEQANKSLQVNKETSSSETFPSTLSGAGITLSNNATYSYNVSADGNNYCLQGTVDGVTKSIAGNNQTVSNSTCVSATNLITNGDFSQGTSGWSSWNVGGPTINNNTYNYTATSQWGNISQKISLITNHIYYQYSFIKGDNSNIYIQAGTSTQPATFLSTFGAFQRLINRFQSDATGSITIYSGVDGRTSGWTQVQIKYCGLIDLTTTFGSGNEPTAAEMDAILANFPNSWFSGQNVIQVPTS